MREVAQGANLGLQNAWGVVIESRATGNTIGGGNVISGNQNANLLIGDPGTSGNVFTANVIGASANGESAIDTSSTGVPGVKVTNFASANVIGPGNLISGNPGDGVYLTGGANNTQVFGNVIGLDAQGTSALANNGNGVLIDANANSNLTSPAFENQIGGGPTLGNVISGNTENGVRIADESSIDGLVNWLPGDGSADDIMSGTVASSGAVYAAAQYGQGFSFVNPGTAIVDGAVQGFGGSSFSVSFWMQTTQTGQVTILGDRTSPSIIGNGFFSVQLAATGRLVAELANESIGGSGATVTSGAALNDGQFHQVVVTRSGPTLRLYVDGMLNDAESSGHQFADGIDTTQPFTIGFEPQDDNPAADISSFLGVIDQVQIYNQAISPVDVRALANPAGHVGRQH